MRINRKRQFFIFIYFLFFGFIFAQQLSSKIEIIETKVKEMVSELTAVISQDTEVGDFKSFTLTDPVRLVIDLYGVTYSEKIKKIKIEKNPIIFIRCSQFQLKPQKIARLSFYLSKIPKYTVIKQGNKIKVNFILSSSDSDFNKNDKNYYEKENFSKTEKNVSLDFVQADIKSVIKALALKVGINVLFAEEMAGKITIRLDNVPWKKALTYILQMKNFTYKYDKSLDVICVGTPAYFKAQEDIKNKIEENEPLKTEIFTLNYAKAVDVNASIQKMLSSVGRIEIVGRTNSLVITDVSTRLKEIENLIKELDGKTPQVMIAAKIIELSTRDIESLGIEWNADVKEKTTTIKGQHADITGGGLATLKVGVIMDKIDLNTTLNLMQTKGEVNILSNPSIATLDNEQASILIGRQIPYYTKDQGGNIFTQYVSAGIKLDVLPHITADNHILMEIIPEISSPGESEQILTTKAKTKVMVKDGETAVIGGLLKQDITSKEDKVPFFYTLPIIGWLFRSESKATAKQELLIFVTPNIIK